MKQTWTFHLKGIRFDFPLLQRLGILRHTGIYRVSWNRHPGPEIHYVLKGDISWELSEPKRPIAVPGGSFVIIPQGISHRAVKNKGTPAFRIALTFERPAAALVRKTPFSRTDLTRIFKRIAQHSATTRRCSSRLTTLLWELVRSAKLESAFDPDGQLHLRTLITDIIYETYTTLAEAESFAPGHEVIPDICNWIEKHCTERILSNRLIKLSGYGRSQFFSLFFAYTGMTPSDYLVRTRVELAKRKLKNRKPGETILNLAIACGFSSASLFSTTFRKHVGMSPRDYVKEQALMYPSASS